jgi:hypothetical protein
MSDINSTAFSHFSEVVELVLSVIAVVNDSAEAGVEIYSIFQKEE